MDTRPFELYSGNGSTINERKQRLSPVAREADLDDPRHYVAEPGLRNAVNVALMLGQPLLITGDPGTGKTQLARSIAHELCLMDQLFIFNTKTSSVARDLFYRYDALRHFHDAQFNRDAKLAVDSYVEYEALGLAILLAMRPEDADPFLPEKLRGRGPVRSVVLVDEFDKAPRDLPNDVLNEIESMAFEVKESGRRFRSDPSLRPILIFTSNSEKNLPDAFLRRCVFYHIPFPEDLEVLKDIVRRRLCLRPTFTMEMLESAIRRFLEIRTLEMKKLPATAELLAWVELLNRLEIDPSRPKPGDAEALLLTYSVLAKNKEDKTLLEQMMGEGKRG